MLDNAVVMAMEHLFGVAMARGHGELVGPKCEAERVSLDPMILSEGPGLQGHHTTHSIHCLNSVTVCALIPDCLPHLPSLDHKVGVQEGTWTGGQGCPDIASHDAASHM